MQQVLWDCARYSADQWPSETLHQGPETKQLRQGLLRWDAPQSWRFLLQHACSPPGLAVGSCGAV